MTTNTRYNNGKIYKIINNFNDRTTHRSPWSSHGDSSKSYHMSLFSGGSGEGLETSG